MSVRRRIFVFVIFALIASVLALVVYLLVQGLQAISDLEEQQQPQVDETQVLLPADSTVG